MTDPDGLTPEERADADARSAAPAGRVLSDARDARGVLRHGSAWPFFAMVVIALGVFSLVVQREPAVGWIAGGLAAYLLWQGYAPVRRISHDADGPLLHPGLGRAPIPLLDYRAARGWSTGSMRHSTLPSVVIFYRTDHWRLLPRIAAGLLPGTTRRRAVVRMSWWHDEDRRMITNHGMNELLQRACRQSGLMVSKRSRSRWVTKPRGGAAPQAPHPREE